MVDIETRATTGIWPNPAIGQINIKGYKSDGGMHIRIIDASGITRLQHFVTETITSIDISQLSKGIYFVQVQPVKGEQRTLRLLKN